MKVIAIISEYNPFHLGHLHQINEIKKIFKDENIAIITIMSGNFIQRGEPAIFNKFKRAESVLKNDVNLCLEIPIQVTLSSAEGFAYGSVKLLNDLNCVDCICFGCEIPDKKTLELIADVFLSSQENELSKYLKDGISFAKSKQLYITEKLNDSYLSKFVSSPNNILAIEYIKALKKLNSKIDIIPIQRIGGNYNDEILNNKFSSATSIRNILNNGEDIKILENHVPNSTYELLNEPKVNKEQMFPYIKYKLLTTKSLEKIERVNEGLDNKFYSEILKSNSIHELILNVKSKRYTYSRLSRILCKYFIGFENFDDTSRFDNYIRVLGFDKKGKDILNKAKKKSSLTIISKFNHKNCLLAPLDILSTRAYSILNSKTLPTEDFIKTPIIKS